MKDKFKKISFYAPETLVKKIETEHKKTDIKKNSFSSFMRQMLNRAIIQQNK